ncbi:glycosyltransferase family 1 protein [Vibrio parahaemolyticus]|nr:glycosyltransferase family 1 protein [Vibrio parahaemolyticus]
MSTMNFAVNATALRKSGALTILKQFVSKAADTNYNFIIFVSSDVEVTSGPNVEFVKVKPKNWLGRILWDFYGFNSALKRYRFKIDKVISLQNTSVNVTYPQIIYVHQPIPFSNIHWDIFSKEGFKFWLYKNFYSFFIFIYSRKDTRYFVQTEWMRESMSNKYKIERNNIFISKPDISLPVCDSSPVMDENRIVLIYPATYIGYKNHIIILKALSILKEEHGLSEAQLTFQVTFDDKSFSKFNEVAKSLGVLEFVENLGVIPYDALIEQYKKASFLVFPSYLETYGLPLAEAATLGKPIFSADLPYSRDVLKGYSGVKFISYNSAESWAESIINNKMSKFYSWSEPERPTWDNFFDNL